MAAYTRRYQRSMDNLIVVIWKLVFKIFDRSFDNYVPEKERRGYYFFPWIKSLSLVRVLDRCVCNKHISEFAFSSLKVFLKCSFRLFRAGLKNIRRHGSRGSKVQTYRYRTEKDASDT